MTNAQTKNPSELRLTLMYGLGFAISIVMLSAGAFLMAFLIQAIEGESLPLWYGAVAVALSFGLKPILIRLYVRITVMQAQMASR